jgi:hypothetical protein
MSKHEGKTKELEPTKETPDVVADVDSEEAEKNEEPVFTQGLVFGTLRLRLQDRPVPREKAGVILRIPKGTVLRINLTESTDNFYNVEYPNPDPYKSRPIVGWVEAKYVDLKMIG